MARYKQVCKPAGTKADLVLRLCSMQSAEMGEAVGRLHAQYSRYALPDQDARKVVDKAMGTATLTEELYRMREG